MELREYPEVKKIRKARTRRITFDIFVDLFDKHFTLPYEEQVKKTCGDSCFGEGYINSKTEFRVRLNSWRLNHINRWRRDTALTDSQIRLKQSSLRTLYLYNTALQNVQTTDIQSILTFWKNILNVETNNIEEFFNWLQKQVSLLEQIVETPVDFSWLKTHDGVDSQRYTLIEAHFEYGYYYQQSSLLLSLAYSGLVEVCSAPTNVTGQSPYRKKLYFEVIDVFLRYKVIPFYTGKNPIDIPLFTYDLDSDMLVSNHPKIYETSFRHGGTCKCLFFNCHEIFKSLISDTSLDLIEIQEGLKVPRRNVIDEDLVLIGDMYG